MNDMVLHVLQVLLNIERQICLLTILVSAITCVQFFGVLLWIKDRREK